MKSSDWIIEVEKLVQGGLTVRQAIEQVKYMINSRMTLENFMDKQQELDDYILINKVGVDPTGKNHRKFLNHRILAMVVECGEFANEVRSFKYWSNKPQSSKEKILGEYVDILFFWLSIGNTLEFTPQEIEEAYKKKYKENIERAKGEY